MKPHLLACLLPFSLVGCVTEYTYEGDLSFPDVAILVAPDANEPVEVIGDAPEQTAPVPLRHLPVLVITTEGALGDTTKVGAMLSVVAEHDGTLGDLDAAPRAYTGAIGIELHGTSSSQEPKKGYRFECRDEHGDDATCALAGLPEASEWVLHAPYGDKTYMRNALAYDIGRTLARGAGRWEPHTAFVEVVLDGAYAGLFVLVERITAEPERLDLPDTTDASTGLATGGFIVKVDQHRGPGFDTLHGTPIDFVWPKATNVTVAELGHLTGWLNGFEETLFSDHFTDPERGYTNWIDVDAWVDHWLVNELTQNVDAYRLSAHLWTDGAPGVARLRAGPIWDFDRAFGNATYCGGFRTEGWIADNMSECQWGSEIPDWWARLHEDPAFELRVRARWQLLRDGALTDEALSTRIATMRAQTAEAEVRDHALWPVIGSHVFPNYYVGETWDDEVSWLEGWVLDRAAWMDDALAE